ncbi:MAG: GspH/FimT family pseudopilin [Pseudomonadota bacterium]
MKNATIKFRKNYAAGYTLLELMVVLSIVAILTLTVVPGMQDTMRRNAKDGTMLDLMSAIALARSEAVTQSRSVSICRSANHAACAITGGADWSEGWLVFTDAGAAGAVDGTDTLLKAGNAANTLSIITLKTFLNNNFPLDFLQFDRDGFLKNSSTGAYLKFCDVSNDTANARAVLVSNTGRTIMSTSDVDGVHNNLAGANLVCP